MKKTIVVKQEIFEAITTAHAMDRHRGRVRKLPISKKVKASINEKLNMIIDTEFPIGASFGIILQDIYPKKGKYVELDNSKGNQLCAIVRDNKIITIFLQRREQNRGEEALKSRLGVDGIIDLSNN